MIWRMLAAIALLAAPALAQEEAKGDPAQGTGPLPPNVAPAPAPICTDRPTKANVACSVPKGAVQLETDFGNFTRDTMAGSRTDTILYTNPTLKYGLGTHTDVEINLAPYETVHMREDGTTDKLGGIGDLVLRLKQRLSADGAKTQVALIPFVKAPTAKQGIGNRRWEGGLIMAVNIPIPAGFTLTLGPEVDILANDEGSGRHADLISLVNLSHSIGKKLTVYAEFWNSQDLDPAGAMHMYSADVAAAYQLSKTLQLDLGANFGLNRATPDEQVYFGISARF